LKGWKIRFSLKSGLHRESKNEKREKKERKGKPTRKEKGRKEKGERKKGERKKGEYVCCSESKKTKGKDDPPRVRVFVRLRCWIQHRGS